MPLTATALLLTAILSSAPDQASRPYAGRALVPLSIAGGLFVAGGIFLGVASSQFAQAAGADAPTRETLMASGLSNRVGGAMLLVAGGFSVALAAFLFWYDPASHVTVALTPRADGAVFSLAWAGL